MNYYIFIIDKCGMRYVYSMKLFICTQESEVSMPFGDRLKQQREKRRLTQVELAERAHVDQSLISRLESKAVVSTNTEVLKRLAQVLGCTTDYLVGMHEDEDSESMPAPEALVPA
jgi:transcriptional regulator with XRE-family HTH domain